MTEDQLQAEAEALCDRLGLQWIHVPDSRRAAGSRGFPDLLAAGPRGIAFMEFKSADGETSAEQDLWLWMLNKAFLGLSPECEGAFEVAVLRPADWEAGRVRSLLESIAGRRT